MPKIKFNGVEIEWHEAQAIDSREAIAMFREDTKIFKLFRPGGTQAADWQRADNLGVPAPYVAFYDGMYMAADRPTWREVTILEMRVVNCCKFFQFSHGGIARLSNWMKQEAATHKLAWTEARTTRLKRMKSAFLAACAAGLQDPQGVFLDDGPNPILFLDIHTSAQPNEAFNQLVSLVDELLKELEP